MQPSHQAIAAAAAAAVAPRRFSAALIYSYSLDPIGLAPLETPTQSCCIIGIVIIIIIIIIIIICINTIDFYRACAFRAPNKVGQSGGYPSL